ncbi:hypothetical protein EMIT0P100_60174 [Pseudomonas sp. IT-P100]
MATGQTQCLSRKTALDKLQAENMFPSQSPNQNSTKENHKNTNQTLTTLPP